MIVYDIASKYARYAGIKYLHLRLFSMYGDEDYSDALIDNCIKKMLKNEKIDLPLCTQNWNYIYSKDAVKQMGLLMDYALRRENFKNESFQIASEDTRSLQYFIKELKKILNSSSELKFGSIQTDRDYSLQPYSLQPDITKTKDAIGFVSNYTFEQGIREILNRNKKNMSNLEKYNKVFCDTLQISEDQLAGLKYQAVELWDSVGHMTLMAELEDTFDIMMETDDIIDFSSYEIGKDILKKYDVVID